MALTDLDDPATERVVLDPWRSTRPARRASTGSCPSPDGSRVAVSLSEHGDEDGTLHVYDVASGEHVGEPIPHVNVMGGSMTWRHDSGALWYTLPAEPDRLPSAGLVPRPRRPAPTTLDLAGPFAEPQISENFLTSSPDGRWAMDRVQKGDGGEWQIFVRAQDDGSAWWQVADIPDRCVHAVLGRRRALPALPGRRPERAGAAPRARGRRHRRRRRDDRARERPSPSTTSP